MQKNFLMQFYSLTQLVFFVILGDKNGPGNEVFMQTLTYFINNLYSEELGSAEHQFIQKALINSTGYIDLVVAGSVLKDVIFEDVDFRNCNFYATRFENCLFINCHFENCNFQFSHFPECNFDLTTWNACHWLALAA
jgi:hypothetical protein